MLEEKDEPGTDPNESRIWIEKDLTLNIFKNVGREGPSWLFVVWDRGWVSTGGFLGRAVTWLHLPSPGLLPFPHD